VYATLIILVYNTSVSMSPEKLMVGLESAESIAA
jgi:hypothetical protein